ATSPTTPRRAPSSAPSSLRCRPAATWWSTTAPTCTAGPTPKRTSSTTAAAPRPTCSAAPRRSAPSSKGWSWWSPAWSRSPGGGTRRPGSVRRPRSTATGRSAASPERPPGARARPAEHRSRRRRPGRSRGGAGTGAGGEEPAGAALRRPGRAAGRVPGGLRRGYGEAARAPPSPVRRTAEGGERSGSALLGGATPVPAAAHVADADHDEPDDRDEHRHHDGLGHVAHVLLDQVPALAEQVAGHHEDRVPDEAAQRGQTEEDRDGHPLDARRDRDEAAEDRDHPAEEHGLGAVLGEPLLGLVDVGDLHQRNLGGERAEPLAAQCRADAVQRQRAHHRTDRGPHDRLDQAQVALGGGE